MHRRNHLEQMSATTSATGRVRQVGLALSGGAVRGLAHVGVLEVLERENIRPDMVAGVSAGSAVGALYCAGMTCQQMKAVAESLSWPRLLRLRRPGLSLFDTTRLEMAMDELLAGKTFDQFDIPFMAVAVDILTSTEVVLREGRVARAVRASCALPGLFSPVETEDQLLVDGGIINNMPVQLLRDAGADYVIAVDLMSPSVRHDRPKNMIELWLLAAYTTMRLAHNESTIADCATCPSVEDMSYIDFENARELIERGRQAGEQALPILQRDLQAKPANQSAHTEM